MPVLTDTVGLAAASAAIAAACGAAARQTVETVVPTAGLVLWLDAGEAGWIVAAMRELNEFNDAVLALAEESGLVDPEARKLFKDHPYVPFYRVMNDAEASGPRFSSGLVNQKAWKKLMRVMAPLASGGPGASVSPSTESA